MTLNRGQARFNRAVANRIVGSTIAKMPGFAMVHHRGRNSDRAYQTPVKIFRHGDGYVITLPYGSAADWVRNVLAAGGCELVVRRQRIALVKPELFIDDGTVRIPKFLRVVLSAMKVSEFLALHRKESASHPGKQ